MKLNHECVRDLLLHLEEHLTYNNYIKVTAFTNEKYPVEDYIYALDKLIEAGYVTGKVTRYLNGELDANANTITWGGHQFLDNIRDDEYGKKQKEYLKKFLQFQFLCLAILHLKL